MRITPIVALAAALLTCGPACLARPLVTLRADPWCPYNCNPVSDHPGYAVEIARTVFGAAGYDVEYRLLNWARSLEDTRLGRTDAVIGAYITDVPGFVLPHEPIGLSAAGFALRPGMDFHYAGPRSLAGHVLGAIATYEFAGELGDYVRANRTDRTRVQLLSGDDALARNIAKLQAGRIDLVLDDANVLAHALQELRPEGRPAFIRTAAAAPVYIAFSPANPASPRLALILDDGIARLRASGALAVILARYQVTDWVRPPPGAIGSSPAASGIAWQPARMVLANPDHPPAGGK